MTTPISDTPVTDFFVKWTPRAIVMLTAGYYGLGIAYELGLMAAIDQVAMQILKHLFGYVGIGAMMPTVQWYSAWGVRIALAIAAGLLYDLAERLAQYVYTLVCEKPAHTPSPSPKA